MKAHKEEEQARSVKGKGIHTSPSQMREVADTSL